MWELTPCLREISRFFYFIYLFFARHRGRERGSSFERDQIRVCISGTVGYRLESDAVAMEFNTFESDARRSFPP